MTADEINGVDPLDEHEATDIDRMAVMDRLLEVVPPSHAYADVAERLHPQVERGYRQRVRVQSMDESRAQHVLYGDRSGTVGRATLRHLRNSLQRCTDPFNNDDPADYGGRVA